MSPTNRGVVNFKNRDTQDLVAVFHQALVLVIIKCNIIQLLASAWLLVNCCK